MSKYRGKKPRPPKKWKQYTTKSISNTKAFVGYSNYAFAYFPTVPSYEENSNDGSSTRINSVTLTRERRSPDFDWKGAIARKEDATTQVASVGTHWDVAGEDYFGIVLKTAEGHTAYTLLRGQWCAYMPSYIGSTPIDIDEGDISALYEQASLKFLLRASALQRRFSGATFIGELRDTLKLITRPGKEVLKRVSDHRRRLERRLRSNRYSGRYNRPGQHWNEGTDDYQHRLRRLISGEWLQLQFGIKPLLSEIDNGVQALAQYMNYTAPTGDVTVKVKNKLKLASPEMPNGIGNILWKEQTLLSKESSVIMRGVVSLSPASPTGPSFTKHFGLRWQDAVLAGWELIPFSFVVDYFTNIGDLLEAHMFPMSTVKWCNYTSRADLEATHKALHGSLSSVYGVQPVMQFYRSGENSCTYNKWFIRRNRTALFVPPLRFRVPGVESLKWLNLGALTYQLTH